MTMIDDSVFQKELEILINSYSIDNEVGVPDYILVECLVNCLKNVKQKFSIHKTKISLDNINKMC